MQSLPHQLEGGSHLWLWLEWTGSPLARVDGLTFGSSGRVHTSKNAYRNSSQKKA